MLKIFSKIEQNKNSIWNIENDIGDEAIFMMVRNDFLQIRENAIIFRKENNLIEIKSTINSISNSTCPCFNPKTLKKLAKEISCLI